jgi:hypothetical protein
VDPPACNKEGRNVSLINKLSKLASIQAGYNQKFFPLNFLQCPFIPSVSLERRHGSHLTASCLWLILHPSKESVLLSKSSF